MNRRNTIKLLGIALAGCTLGHWAIGHDAVKKLMENSSFDPDEQDLIAAIADTIIPKQAQFSALELGVPVYLLAYFSRCIGTDIQENIKRQLKALNESATNQYGVEFHRCSAERREQLLLAFSESELAEKKNFFDLMKTQTIEGFRTTKEVMTTRYHYRIVPGLYHGCIDINEPSIT